VTPEEAAAEVEVAVVVASDVAPMWDP